MIDRMNLLFNKAEEAILKEAKVGLKFTRKGFPPIVTITISKEAANNWKAALEDLEPTEDEKTKSSLFFNTARKKLTTIKEVEFLNLPHPIKN